MSLRQREASAHGGSESYFFATPALRLRMDLVQDYVQRGETPVLITGETGAGKSAFLNQIMKRVEHDWRVIRIPAVASFSASDIMAFFSTKLRLPVRASSEEMTREFDRWFERIAARGQIAVVVVDGAHELSDQGIAQIARLPECVQSDSCRVLLTGLPDLRARLTGLLGHSAMPARVINIPGLDRREVASYIDMKLYYAGLEDRRVFSRTVIDDIARCSRGHPGRIDAMAKELLKDHRMGSRWRHTSDRLWRIMRGLAVSRSSFHRQ